MYEGDTDWHTDTQTCRYYKPLFLYKIRKTHVYNKGLVAINLHDKTSNYHTFVLFGVKM
jgi:hypothetical protein